jgi:Translation initiation factor IF-3, N-terminal domain
MISPDAAPPVVRLIEVSKLKYEQEKAKKEAGRKSRAARCAFQGSRAPFRVPFHTRLPLGGPSQS